MVSGVKTILLSPKQLLFVALLLTISAFVPAQQSGGDFEITSSTIDSGGGTSVGGQFSLSGTIGQPDATSKISSGGDFVLAGGFWANAVDRLFGDGFEGD